MTHLVLELHPADNAFASLLSLCSICFLLLSYKIKFNLHIHLGLYNLRDRLDCGCMRYLSIVSVSPTVDGGRCTPSLEKQQEYRCRKLSNVLLWTGSGLNIF